MKGLDGSVILDLEDRQGRDPSRRAESRCAQTLVRPRHSMRLLVLLLWLELLGAARACNSHKHSNHHRDLHELEEVDEQETDIVECGMPPPSDDEKRLLGQAHADWAINNKHRDLSVSSYEVPVYWHVLQHNDTYGALQRSTIVDGYMPVLNKAYEVTPFTFILQGIDYVINEQFFLCNNTQGLQKIMHQGGTNALNIYVCNTYVKGLAGYAYLPAIVKVAPLYLDSVFVMNADVSRAYLSNYWTLVHEVGHWLGLLHTFEGGCSPDVRSFYSGYYYLSGDGVSDTPAQVNGTSSRPGQSKCWRLTPPINSCPDNVTGIDLGDDAVNNYMDYGTGYCRQLYGFFSPQQIQRMVAQWETFRYVADQGPLSAPTLAPSASPSLSSLPSASPSRSVWPTQSQHPSASPSLFPSPSPSNSPSAHPSQSPTALPTATPSTGPSWQPSIYPTDNPSKSPTNPPSPAPTKYMRVVKRLARQCAKRVARKCGDCADRSCVARMMRRCRQPDASSVTRFEARVTRFMERFCKKRQQS